MAKQAKIATLDPLLNRASNLTLDRPNVQPKKPIESISIQALRDKLHAKIASLKTNRQSRTEEPKSKQDILDKRSANRAKPVKPASASTVVKGEKRKVDEMLEDTTANNSDQDNKKQKTIVEDVSFGVIKFGEEKIKAGIDTMSKLKKVHITFILFDLIHHVISSFLFNGHLFNTLLIFNYLSSYCYFYFYSSRSKVNN